jgi:microcystin-dependent protein
MPTHTHILQGTTNAADTPSPIGARLGMELSGITNPYSTAGPNEAMNPATITNVGGSQPHANMMPYLTLNFCIALQGIFPSRN